MRKLLLGVAIAGAMLGTTAANACEVYGVIAVPNQPKVDVWHFVNCIAGDVAENSFPKRLQDFLANSNGLELEVPPHPLRFVVDGEGNKYADTFAVIMKSRTTP